MARTFTPDQRNPNGSTTVHVKRSCNGCGTILGDVTDEEMDRVMAGLPPEDVRGECSTCTPLILTCGGREVDQHLRPVGEPCGRTYPRRHSTDDQMIVEARAAGWSIGHHDGALAVTCPACGKPRPGLGALLRQIATRKT